MSSSITLHRASRLILRKGPRAKGSSIHFTYKDGWLVRYGKGKGRKEPMHIADDAFYSAEDFVIPSHYEPYIEKILLPHGLVVDRVEKLAMDIRKHYFQKELHLLCVLKGSRGFFNLLIHFLNKMQMYDGARSCAPPYMEHYVRLKSYRNDSTVGKLQIIGDDLSILKGKHVLIVEDIIDTGYTLTQFGRTLQEYCPQSLRVACLLEKRTTRSNGFKGDFVAFSVADHFVVGFCYDFNEIVTAEEDLPHQFDDGVNVGYLDGHKYCFAEV